jgi:hypothetical protein
MEASYPVDRVTRFAGTNKRSVYMELSYSALVCSIHSSYMKYLNLAAKSRIHACAVGKSFSQLAEFPGQNVYMVKYSSRLGEIQPLFTGNSPSYSANSSRICADAQY